MSTTTVAAALVKPRRVGAARERAKGWLIAAVIAFALVYTVFPVLWLLLNSFKTRLDLFAVPPIWLPADLTL